VVRGGVGVEGRESLPGEVTLEPRDFDIRCARVEGQWTVGVDRAGKGNQVEIAYEDYRCRENELVASRAVGSLALLVIGHES
jgi:hypothetical protein